MVGQTASLRTSHSIGRIILKCIEILAITAALLSPLISRAALIEADYVGISLKMNGSSLMGALEKDWPKASGAIITVPEISLSEDLHSRVQSQRLSASDALQIEGELMSHQGATYFLPQSQAELKLSVGFPKDTYLNKDDLREIIPVHVQVSINVSPLTASYIVDKLGVRTTAEPGDAVTEMKVPVEPGNAPPLANPAH